MTTAVQKLSQYPFVATYDNFLDDVECQHFIEISKNNFKRALVSSDKQGFVSKGRTGSNTWIPHDYDDTTMAVCRRLAKLVDMPLENAEGFQLIHYDVEQEYRSHFDSWKHDKSDKTLRCMKYGGARLKTVLCYLNNVKKGGGTRMTKLDITVQPVRGRCLVFDNTMMADPNPDNRTHDRHPLSEHSGMPVLEGEKYAFNLWFRECPKRQLYREFNPDYYA